MSFEASGLVRLRVFEESTMSTEASSSISSFVDVPCTNAVKPVAGYEMLPIAVAEQRKFAYRPNALGRKWGTFSVTCVLAGTGTAATAGVFAAGSTSTPKSALGIMLKSALGGETLGRGRAIAGGASATSVPVTSGASGDFGPGVLVGGTVGGATQWRIAKSYGTTGPVVPKLAFSSTPTGDLVSSACYYLDQDSNGNTSNTLQFVYEGSEADDKFWFLGCQVASVSFDFPMGQLPTVTFNYMFTDWKANSEVGTPLSGGVSAATYSYFSPSPVVNGALYQQTVGTTTYTASTGSTEGSEVHASSTTWNLGITHQRVLSPSAIGNTQAFVRMMPNNAPAASGSFTCPFQTSTGTSTSWMYAQTNRVNKAIWQLVGTTPGSVAAIEAPTIQVVGVDHIDDNGLRAQTVNWIAREDQDVTATSDQHYSPLRVSLG